MEPSAVRAPERHESAIVKEAREVAGEDWMRTENPRLGGKTSAEVMKQGKAGRELVRDILRSIRYVGSS
jgi:uncharacterized protein (DUF2384 family)